MSKTMGDNGPKAAAGAPATLNKIFKLHVEQVRSSVLGQVSGVDL